MSELDAAGIAQLAVRVGLIDDNTARECIYELDDRRAPPEAMTRLMERKGLITPLQSSRLLKGDTEGYFLGGYRLLYKIASGSFGRVYRGDDPRSGQIVAIKVLRKKWTEDKRKVDLFEREGRLGLTLQHPNIVQILHVNKDPVTGQYFIVMDFIEGGNMRDILSIRQKLEYDEALRIMEECSAGLAYAHSRGLTHRDIKPTNILIGTDKVARLVDFGLAEMSHAGQAVFYDKGHGKEKDDMEVDRTVDYAGLERLTGQKKGDPRSDIYFLGTVFFEMVTGQAILPPTRDRTCSSRSYRCRIWAAFRSRVGGRMAVPVIISKNTVPRK
jgi:serine/threonine protein kinase